MTKLQKLKQAIQRASDLEEELASLPPRTSEEKASAIRLKLCEIFSDVIMTDPPFAHKRDCFNRMWKGSFYGCIADHRTNISKERKRRDGPNVTRLQRAFLSFLDEAIALYAYLIEKYEGKLLPYSSQSQPSSQSSQEISEDDDDNNNNDSNNNNSHSNDKDNDNGRQDNHGGGGEERGKKKSKKGGERPTEGVVHGLCRMYIQLGDLHRYKASWKDAEQAYTKAAKLAPGKGNPYNQLAVVALQKNESSSPLSCVAFYLYARALLATHDPFATAKGNLLRLMELNRDHLSNLPSVEQEIRSFGIPTKKAAQELERRKKSAASRRFLTEFVDLHYDLIVFKKQNMSELELIQKMERLLENFEKMLIGVSLGDPLLVKMVAINAFSVSMCADSHSPNDAATPALARAFVLRFGSALADRVIQHFQHGTIKNRATPSYRCLSPLILNSEYAAHFSWHGMDMSGLVRRFADEAETAMWSKVAHAANLWKPFRKDVGSRANDTVTFPKDYETLRGFSPFGFIQVKELFVSPEEAVVALELDFDSDEPAHSPNHQRTSRSSDESKSSNDDDNMNKLRRFFTVMANVEGGKVKKDRASGAFRILSAADRDDDDDDNNDREKEEEKDDKQDAAAEATATVIEDVEEDDGDKVTDSQNKRHKCQDVVPLAFANEEDADDGGDVIMYKPSGKDGSGPPLLVPKALLVGKAHEPKHDDSKQKGGIDLSGKLTAGSSRSPDSSAPKAPVPPPQPFGLSPPPGFGSAPAAAAAAPPPPPPAAPPASFLLQQLAPVLPSVPRSPMTHGSPLRSEESLPMASAQQVPTVRDAILSQPVQTANPFLTQQPSPEEQFLASAQPLGLGGLGPPRGPTVLDAIYAMPIESSNPFLQKSSDSSYSGSANIGTSNPPGASLFLGNSDIPKNPRGVDGANNLDATSLLDSSLLNSLWGLEGEGNKHSLLPKNPFYT